MKLDMSSEQLYPSTYLKPDFQIRDINDQGGLDLSKIFGAIRRQGWVIAGTTILFAAIGGIKAATDTPIYQAQFELLPEPVSLESQVISSTTQDSLSNRPEVMVPNEAKLKILKSPRVLEPLAEELQAQYPEITYKTLANYLTLDADVKSNIVQVQYEHENPQQVQDVLEQVAETYLQFSVELRQSELNKGLKFVEKQLPRLRSRVDEIQNQLQKLRQDNNFIDPAMEAEQLSEQIGMFVQQRLEVKAELNETELLAQDLNQELSDQPVEQVAASALSNDRYQDLLKKLQELDTKIAEQSVTFAETSPQLETLREQRQNLIPLLEGEAQRVQRGVESEVRELQARDRALGETIQGLNQRSKQLSQMTRQYTDLQRELEIASDNLSQFLTKREALSVDVAQSDSPWELLTPPSEPVASVASIQRNLVLGTALGLLLGIGVALAVDRFRNLLHSTRDIQEAVALPLLGTIPFDKVLAKIDDANLSLLPGSSKLLNHNSSILKELAPPAIESFRSLYTNFRLLNPDSPVRSFVVSSAMLGEGKSTIAFHLARAAAAMGKRVLLVDTDLRRSKRDRPTESLGLTDLIHQSDLEVNQVIEQSQLEESLFILPSGQLPPDPSRLLASEKMQHVMEQLQSEFELVIYDTTILTGFTDAHLLATATDGLVLVTGVGKLKRSILEETIEKLKVSRTPLLGIVVNGDKNLSVHLYQ